jgi:two-component system, sensor histidine kinase and response regulator
MMSFITQISNKNASPKAAKKILIVESDLDVRNTLTQLLLKNDYKVKTVENGYDGYKTAVIDPPELIIADIMIPMMDGLEMLRLLKENAATAGIPFIFLTSKSATIDRRIGMNSGADDYITIPFKPDDLLKAIRVRLEKKENLDRKFERVFRALSGNIPHELRTPLGSIIGFTNMMLEDILTLDRKDMIEMLQKIKYSSTKLQKTIEKFIVFSEAEVLNMDKKKHESLLNKKTEVQAFLLDSIINEKMRQEDVNFPVELSNSYASISVFEDHFCMMFGELIENAIKFSYNNKPIEIKSTDDKGTYTLKVRNYGKGLTEEELQNLDVFTNQDRRRYEQHGNGLGLILVSRLATFYDAKFSITSIPDQYTETSLKFKKYIPS